LAVARTCALGARRQLGVTRGPGPRGATAARERDTMTGMRNEPSTTRRTAEEVQAAVAGRAWPPADAHCRECGASVTGPFLARGGRLTCLGCLLRPAPVWPPGVAEVLRPPTYDWRECPTCARPFVRRSRRFRYCTAACRVARPRPPRRPPTPAERGCGYCGEPFTPLRTDGRYCSGACVLRAAGGRPGPPPTLAGVERVRGRLARLDASGGPPASLPRPRGARRGLRRAPAHHGPDRERPRAERSRGG
jgi:hypothetical protein